MTAISFSEAIERLSKPSPYDDLRDLNKVFWAAVQRFEWPLAPYQEDHFHAAREENNYPARCVSNMMNLMTWFRDEWPEHYIETKARPGHLQVIVRINGLGHGVVGDCYEETHLEALPRIVAVACLKAHEIGVPIRAALSQLDGIGDKLPEWKDWPIEEIGDRHHAVIHEHRLMSPSFASRETVVSGEPLIVDALVLLKMRQRYNAAFGEAGPDTSSPSP